MGGTTNTHAVSDVAEVTYAGRAHAQPCSGRAGAAEQPPPELVPTSALAEPFSVGSVLTRHAPFAAILEQVRKVADTELSLLILGETGTGKEHFARSVHSLSRRAGRPFVAINCASVPEGLIESELFGHEKGAFTAAQGAREGAFVAANGGTLLLDELGDAPLRVQLALLRVLETRTVKAIGADRERPVNVRIIAATSRELPSSLEQREFRLDLYFRLADYVLTIPPLRERAVDIPLLAHSLLIGLGRPAELSPDASALLRRHPWFGNVRELRNALRRALHFAEGEAVLQADHFAGLEQCALGLSQAPGASPSQSPLRRSTPSTFPERVRDAGEHLWRAQALPALDLSSQYERRAVHRAALLYLSLQQGRAAFPQALQTQWEQLFGARWASSEKERGVKDVLRTLGLRARDPHARQWLLASVAGS
jgi:transcriptional regulator with GAF, ATPase, and Fis domain